MKTLPKPPLPLPIPNETQYLHNFNPLYSNSIFSYKEISSRNYNHPIPLNNPVHDPPIYLQSNLKPHHINHYLIKSNSSISPSAFHNADIHTQITSQLTKHKYQLLLQKEQNLEQLVNTRNKSIQNEIAQEKLSLKNELTQIIRDALLFSKKNNPMTSMLPNSINEIISKVKEDNKALNISVSSINLTQTSKASIRSIQKYESNAFLKALGIDLLNLHPDNININVDKAYEFISKWKTDRNVRQVIRYKVVNEIMSIAEKRASQKVEKINKKLKVIKDKAREENIKRKRLKEEERYKQELLLSQTIDTASMMHRYYSTGQKMKTPVVEVRKKYKHKNTNNNNNVKRYNPLSKTLVRYNSYKNLDKIISFINQSDSLKENVQVCKHFNNLNDNQDMNQIVKRLKRKNRLQSAG